jgi:ribonuclease HII
MRFPDEAVFEVGVDESGRGSVISVVVAGAAIMPPLTAITNEADRKLYLAITDSKKVTKQRRDILVEFIKRVAVAWGVGIVDAEEIDEINILQATYKAMHQALDAVARTHDIQKILVDGNRFKQYRDIPHTCIIKGDANVLSIAAGSIIAKTTHDDIIQTLVSSDPDMYSKYDLLNNMGYATKRHIQAIQTHGLTPKHRRTFVLKSLQTQAAAETEDC